MTIRLYNTLTKSKDVFVPIDPKNVRMYVCGPTVYDYAHIGNARPVIVFDVLFRLLRHAYGDNHVTYVRNITDIDDKINARALERRGNREILTALRELTEETQRIYLEDVTALGNLPPSYTPRATEHVAQMIAMIARLIAAGHAYVAQGHVLFDVSSKADYGKLARRSLDDMIAGARVEVAPYKKNATDFVLWKPSDEDTPGWESPWGRGRPGWHIECSAMAEEYLGESFDIHGGGIDLVFPHHENEIAQSEGAHHDHPLANVWMHNGFLNVEGEKMSKSLGNFVTIREILTGWNGTAWPGPAVKFNMLQTHYRQPMDWTAAALDESHKTLWDWAGLLEHQSVSDADVPVGVIDALQDDLNTPRAFAEMHALKKRGELGELAAALRLFGISARREDLRRSVSVPLTGVEARAAAGHLQITGHAPTVDISGGDAPALPSKLEIEQQIEIRNAARKARDFKESDRIRDELLAKGIVLKDGPGGTTWEVKR